MFICLQSFENYIFEAKTNNFLFQMHTMDSLPPISNDEFTFTKGVRSF